MSRAKLVKEVKDMLKEFNSYFSYIHGKSDTVNLEMPDAAVMVWVRIYEQLTEEERDRAKQATYEKHRFHPTPEEFKQLVKGNDEAEAMNEWIIILDALRMGADDAKMRILCLTSHARKALRICGGLAGLGARPEHDLQFASKDFCRAWRGFRDSATLTPHPLEMLSEQTQAKSTEPLIDVSADISKLIRSFGATR